MPRALCWRYPTHSRNLRISDTQPESVGITDISTPVGCNLAQVENLKSWQLPTLTYSFRPAQLDLGYVGCDKCDPLPRSTGVKDFGALFLLEGASVEIEMLD